MNGRRWTERHTEILRRMAGKFTDEEISLQTGHATITIRKRRECLGLAPCRRIDWTRRYTICSGFPLTS